LVTLAMLRGYKSAQERLARAEQKLEELETPLYDARIPKLTGMPRAQAHGSGSAQEKLADATIELRDYYAGQMAKLRRNAARIERELDELEPELLADVLRLRFIDGLTLEATAERMNYSVRHIRRLQRKAILKLKQP